MNADTFKPFSFLGLLLRGAEYIERLEVLLVQFFFKDLLKEIRPAAPYSTYNVCKPVCPKLLIRLRLDLSHLNEHRINHNFENCINPYVHF